MKKRMCTVLILSLTLAFLTISYAQETDIDPLRASDVNADGTVDILDLTFIASNFGKAITGDQVPNPDVNADGAVDILDLTLVARNLGKAVPPPVAFVSVDPVSGSELDVDSRITFTFDSRPDDVTVNEGSAKILAKNVRITGPFTPGPLTLTVTWADGSKSFSYTVRAPDTEASDVIDGTVDAGETFVEPEPVDTPIPVDDSTFEAIVLESEVPIVVEFWAGW